MRKYLALLSVLGAGAGLSLLGPAQAVAHGGAIHYASCPDTVFTTEVGGFTFNYCFTDVATPSGNANAHFHGNLVDPATAPSKATKVAGFGCFASYPVDGYTTDTSFVVTPSGEVNGTCKFHF
jgi:hypothetical protein